MPGLSFPFRYLSTRIQQALPLQRYQALKLAWLQNQLHFKHLSEALFKSPQYEAIKAQLSTAAQANIAKRPKNETNIFKAITLKASKEESLERLFNVKRQHTAFGLKNTLGAMFSNKLLPFKQDITLNQNKDKQCDSCLVLRVASYDERFQSYLQDAIMLARKTSHYRLWWHFFWLKQRLYGNTFVRLLRYGSWFMTSLGGLFITLCSAALLSGIALPAVVSTFLVKLSTLFIVSALSPWIWLGLGMGLTIVAFHKLHHDSTLEPLFPFNLIDNTQSKFHQGIIRGIKKILQQYKFHLGKFSLTQNESYYNYYRHHSQHSYNLLTTTAFIKLILNPLRLLLGVYELTHYTVLVLIDIACLGWLWSPLNYLGSTLKCLLHLPMTFIAITLEALVDATDIIWDVLLPIARHGVGVLLIACQLSLPYLQQTFRTIGLAKNKKLESKILKPGALPKPATTSTKKTLASQDKWWQLVKNITFEYAHSTLKWDCRNETTIKDLYNMLLVAKPIYEKAPQNIGQNRDSFYISYQDKKLPLAIIVASYVFEGAPKDIKKDGDYFYINYQNRKLPLAVIIASYACHELVLGTRPSSWQQIYHLPNLSLLQQLFYDNGTLRYSPDKIPTNLKLQYQDRKQWLIKRFKKRSQHIPTALAFKRHYKHIAKRFESLRTLLENNTNKILEPKVQAEINDLLMLAAINFDEMMARLEAQAAERYNGKPLTLEQKNYHLIERLADRDKGSDDIAYFCHNVYTNLTELYIYFRKLTLEQLPGDSNPFYPTKEQKIISKPSRRYTLQESMEQQWRRLYNSNVAYGFYQPYGGEKFYNMLLKQDPRVAKRTKKDTYKQLSNLNQEAVNELPKKYLYKLCEHNNSIDAFSIVSQIQPRIQENSWIYCWGMHL